MKTKLGARLMFLFLLVAASSAQMSPCGPSTACAPVSDCQVGFSQMAELSRRPCNLDSSQRGLCCPAAHHIGEANGMPCPSNPDKVSLSEVNTICDKCLMNMRIRQDIESRLFSSGVVPKRSSSQFAHSQLFVATRKTRSIARGAAVINDVTKHVAKIFKRCFNTPTKKLAKLLQGMPDISQTTLPPEMCQASPTCPGGLQRYRTADGSCNNALNPDWGQTNVPFVRLLAPVYGDDGVDSFRKAESGRELPPVRKLSTSTFVTNKESSYADFTIVLMQWGQFLDHDVTHTPNAKAVDDTQNIQCCTDEGVRLKEEDLHEQCAPIQVPEDDSFYKQWRVSCIDFVRSMPANNNCKFRGHREQMNQITAYIDGSNVYGSSDEEGTALRALKNGLLKTQADGLLPNNPDQNSCDFSTVTKPCFKAGDSRVNEQLNLVVMHTVWVVQHNLIATKLRLVNNAWSDETLYQEARRIVGAQMQHITYSEYLPIVLGEKTMKDYGMLPLKEGYTNKYSAATDATISNVFATAAFRYGHTLIDSTMLGLSTFGSNTLEERLSDVQFDVRKLYKPNAIENQLRGLSQQTSPKFDHIFTKEITESLFKKKKPWGMDLVALNLQRGRDHGLPGYASWRKVCQLPPVTTFTELGDVMHVKAAEYLQQHLYDHVDDIDVFLGAILETPVDDSLVGHTFRCLLKEQFSRSQRGDRFYYENGNFPNSFTPAQLQEIRKTTLTQVICASYSRLQLQPNIFRVASVTNLRKSCNSYAQLDLTAWKD